MIQYLIHIFVVIGLFFCLSCKSNTKQSAKYSSSIVDTIAILQQTIDSIKCLSTNIDGEQQLCYIISDSTISYPCLTSCNNRLINAYSNQYGDEKQTLNAVTLDALCSELLNSSRHSLSYIIVGNFSILNDTASITVGYNKIRLKYFTKEASCQNCGPVCFEGKRYFYSKQVNNWVLTHTNYLPAH